MPQSLIPAVNHLSSHKMHLKKKMLLVSNWLNPQDAEAMGMEQGISYHPWEPWPGARLGALLLVHKALQGGKIISILNQCVSCSSPSHAGEG